jgi:hypothetical protein
VPQENEKENTRCDRQIRARFLQALSEVFLSNGNVGINSRAAGGW